MLRIFDDKDPLWGAAPRLPCQRLSIIHVICHYAMAGSVILSGVEGSRAAIFSAARFSDARTVRASRRKRMRREILRHGRAVARPAQDDRREKMKIDSLCQVEKLGGGGVMGR